MYGQMLRKLREAKGRAQADVARKADISPAQLARLETEQRGLYVDDFVRIAEVLGEKPGNLLPNDLGHIGHLKPLIDRLGGLEPEFLGRVEAILEKIILLTDDVMITMRMQTVQDTNGDRNGRRPIPARTMARLEKILDGRSQQFSGVVSAERGIILSEAPARFRSGPRIPAPAACCARPERRCATSGSSTATCCSYAPIEIHPIPSSRSARSTSASS